MLEKGVAPWQKPWEGAAMPFNPTTERSYRGGNAVHLMATAVSRGYQTGISQEKEFDSLGGGWGPGAVHWAGATHG